jgi:hypothetical protein
MNPRARSLAAVAIGVALATLYCASSPYATGAHIDTEYDFEAVDRLAFARVPSKPLTSPHGKILRSALEESLTARGFEWVGEDEAQLWISYDVGVFSASSVSWGQQGGPGQGRIVVRAIDPETSREVWYGWAQAHLRSTPDPERRIRAAVEALLEDRVRSGS